MREAHRHLRRVIILITTICYLKNYLNKISECQILLNSTEKISYVKDNWGFMMGFLNASQTFKISITLEL